jgi:hypothetical protein
MATTIAMVSLVAALGANLAPGQLTWERDYRQARVLGEKLQKPLAVFVGSGTEGWKQISRDSKLEAAVQKTLTDGYVRVYIDVSTASGRKIADAFGITENTGLVISDKTGDVQAYWHQGNLTATDLAKVLTRYGAKDFVVRTTETQSNTASTLASLNQYSFQPVCQT